MPSSPGAVILVLQRACSPHPFPIVPVFRMISQLRISERIAVFMFLDLFILFSFSVSFPLRIYGGIYSLEPRVSYFALDMNIFAQTGFVLGLSII